MRLVRLTGFVLTLGLLSPSLARALPWQPGDVITFSQGTWGDPSTSAATLLVAQFANVYPSNLEVGIPGTSGFSMHFTSGNSVVSYLPAPGAPSTLTADLLNPSSSSSGSYGGEVVALALNVDFSSLLGGDAGVDFGSLRLNDFPVLPALNGMTVTEILVITNTVLGGGTAVYGVDEMVFITNLLNVSFAGGTPSTFAQDHLAVPEPSSWLLLGFGVLGLGWAQRRRR